MQLVADVRVPGRSWPKRLPATGNVFVLAVHTVPRSLLLATSFQFDTIFGQDVPFRWHLAVSKLRLTWLPL